MKKLSVGTLSLILSSGDRDDLEHVRQRIGEWTGVDGVSGPEDHVLVYVALLRLVEHVAILERYGNDESRKAFAMRFFLDQDEDVE